MFGRGPLLQLGWDSASQATSQPLFIVLKSFIYLTCTRILPTCISVPHVYAWCLQRPEENVTCSGIRVAECWELPLGWQESNLGLPKEQPVYLLSHLSSLSVFMCVSTPYCSSSFRVSVVFYCLLLCFADNVQVS